MFSILTTIEYLDLVALSQTTAVTALALENPLINMALLSLAIL